MKKLFILLYILGLQNLQSQTKDSTWYLIDPIHLNNISSNDKRYIDSVLNLYHSAKTDTSKLRLLYTMSESIKDNNLWHQYTKCIIPLCVNKPERIYQYYYAKALNNLGFSARLKGEMSSAYKLYNQALKIRLTINDKAGVSESYHNIGIFYQLRNENEAALENLLKALEIEKEINQIQSISNTYGNIGIIYLRQGEIETAIPYLDNSLKYALALNNPDQIADSYNYLGEAYMSDGNFDDATTCYSNALKNADSTNLQSRQTISYHGLANAYFMKKDYDQAENFGRKAFDLATELGLAVNIVDASNILYNIYKHQKRFEDALKMYEINSIMNDSINSKDQQKLFSSIEYESKESLLNAEHEKATAISAAENSRQKIIIWSVSGFLMLMLILSVVVIKMYNDKKKANHLINKQKDEVEEKRKEIIDSINYAKRIQQAIFKDEGYTSKHLPEHFILFKPKDIVSGDFYWSHEKGDYLYLTAADCTGHGVPGAFLTMLGVSFLNEINALEVCYTPAQILDRLREKVVKELGAEGQNKDGMDISLIRLNLKTKELMWAGANNPLWYISDNNLYEIKANKQPIGYYEKTTPFTNHTIQLKISDTIYLFTDGYADQFGGPKGKKFKYKQLQDLLQKAYKLALPKQKLILNNAFESWKGKLDQIDDVIVIGLKV